MMRDLTPKELQTYLETCETAPLLLDVRETWEYEICHLAGSVLIPTGQIMNLAGGVAAWAHDVDSAVPTY